MITVRFIFLGLCAALAVLILRGPKRAKTTFTEPDKPVLSQTSTPKPLTQIQLPAPRPIEETYFEPPPLPISNESEPPPPVVWRPRSAPQLSKGWPGWRCYDLEGGPPYQSMWMLEEQPFEAGILHEGTCNDWESKPPPEG